MTREEYIKFHRECCDKMVAITAQKNADYSGGSPTDNAFANFTGIEALGVTTTEVGFLTRMYDKFSRISTFVKKGVLQVKDESIEDTLLDLANYCILFAGYIRGKKQAQGTLAAFDLNSGKLMDVRLKGELLNDGRSL